MDELISIPLANGSVTHPDKLRAYFERVIAAEQSGEEFAVNLDDVWRIGYATKGGAVKVLRKNFVKDIDYQSFIQLDEREIGATSVETFHLSVSCLEYLAVRANRDVFEVYRSCRKALGMSLGKANGRGWARAVVRILRQARYTSKTSRLARTARYSRHDTER